MQEAFSVEIWIMSIVCSGYLGWVLGGRERMSERAGHEVQFLPSPAHVEQPLRADILPAPDPGPAVTRQRASRARRAARMSVFADMPPLDVVSDKARAIRSSANVWDAPDISRMIDEYFEDLDAGSRAVLRKFRVSVDKLGATTEAPE